MEMFIQRFLKSIHSWTSLSELMKIPWGIPPEAFISVSSVTRLLPGRPRCLPGWSVVVRSHS